VPVADASEPVAVRAYTVLTGGVTLLTPLLHATGPTPWSITQLAAFMIPLHDSATDCPAVTVAGLAVNDPITGVGPLTVTLQVAVVPLVTVTAYVPAAA